MGLDYKADSPTIMFILAFWSGWHIFIGVFSFKRCIVQLLGYLLLLDFSVVSNLDSLSSTPLLRILLRVQYLGRFWRGFRNGLVKLTVIYAQYGLTDLQIFLAVSGLVNGLLLSFNRAIIVVVSLDYCLLLPWIKGDP